MLKRDITFDDFNGDKVTETHYFNLTKVELVELETKYAGGLEKNIMSIAEAKDARVLFKEFKDIILMSYGQKSPDGKLFKKSDELKEEFAQTAAFDALMMEILGNEEAAAKFIAGVMPADLAEAVAKDKKSLQDAVAEKLGTTPKTTAEIAAEQA